MRKILETVTFVAEGDASRWFSANYGNWENIIEFILYPNSDWEGIVVIDRSYKASPSSDYSEIAIMGIGEFDPSVSIYDPKEGVKYRMRCAMYVSGTARGEVVR